MNDALLVQIANSGYQLGKQPSCSIVLEVPVVEDVVEKLSARCILKNDADLRFRLGHLVQTDNIRVGYLLEDGNLAVYLC